VEMRCVDGVAHIDLEELRRRVDQHHWLRRYEGFRRCPDCRSELAGHGGDRDR
jgi:hypothetical protein